MQNIYHIDSKFVKENSVQYILSIRYATDGFSFCIHDSYNKLLVFSHQPHILDAKDAVIAKVTKTIIEDELLSLRYQKVYVISCFKEKILIPVDLFDKHYLSEMYRICIQPEKNDTLLYRKIDLMASYITETLPRNFVTFLTTRYQSTCIVNSAYPFIINSLSRIEKNKNYLFIDIQCQYFDVLLIGDNEVLLFNSFSYNSVADLVYYTLNCLEHCNVIREDLQTTISGNLVNDAKLLNTFNNYIPNISVLNDMTLSHLIKNSELNSSCFFHLLNLHQCE